MSLKQEKRVGKERSPKTKREKKKKVELPKEQLARLAFIAKHTLSILEQTSEHLDEIVKKEYTTMAKQMSGTFPEHCAFVKETLAQIQGVSSALMTVHKHAEWELFERIEPPLTP